MRLWPVSLVAFGLAHGRVVARHAVHHHLELGRRSNIWGVRLPMTARVLIVNNEPGDAFLIAEAVKSVVDADVALTVSSALSALTQQPPPALVVLDSMMSGELDSQVVADFIRGRDWGEHPTPVLLSLAGSTAAVNDAMVAVERKENGPLTVQRLVEAMLRNPSPDAIAELAVPVLPEPPPYVDPVPWRLIITLLGVGLSIPMLVVTVFLVRELADGGKVSVHPPTGGSVEVEIPPD